MGDQFLPALEPDDPEGIPVELSNFNITPYSLNIIYEDQDVEEGRTNYPEIVDEFQQNNQLGSLQGEEAPLQYYQYFNPGLIAITDIIDTYPILSYYFNTSYEEIKCVGLNSRASTMTAIIQIKRPYGYRGDKCTTGSKEYVRFWIDWDCDGFDPNDDIGLGSVTVHDLEGSLPAEGVYFAVSVNFTNKQPRLCDDVNVYPVRAILSWNVPPGPVPSFNYHWGNVMDRCVQLEPIGEECTPGNLCPHITTIGGVAPIQIDPNTGYANGPAVFDGWTAIDSPFGGLVTITGDVLNVPDFVYDCDCNNIDYSTDMRYKFEYRRWSYEDSNWSEWDDMTAQHNDRFLIYVDKVCDFGPTMICDQLVKWNIRDSEGFYSYYEDIYGDIRQYVAGKVLMKWSTTGLVDGLYEIRMVIKFGAAIMEFSRRKMILDNTAPQ